MEMVRNGAAALICLAGTLLAHPCASADAHLMKREPDPAVRAERPYGPVRTVVSALGDGSLVQILAGVESIGAEVIGRLDSHLAVAVRPGGQRPLEPFHASVANAVASHPEALAVRAFSRAQGYSVSEARAAWLPQLTGSSEGGRRDYGASRYSSLVTTPERTQAGIGLSLVARQLVYDFGAADAAIETGRLREAESIVRAEALHSELALRAVTAFYESYRGRQQLALAEMSAHAQAQLVSFLDERYRIGGGTLSDVVRARAKAAEARATMSAVENRLRNSQAVYREIFGRTPADEAEPPDMPLGPDDLAARHEQKPLSPVLRQSEIAVGVARSDVANARARAKPSVSAEVSLSRRDLAGNGLPGTDATALIVLRHGLYTGGADTARIGQTMERLSQSEHDFEALKRQVERTVQQARADVTNGDRIVHVRAQAAEALRDSLVAVREQFALRRGSLLDLLRAMEELHVATRELIDAVVDRSLAKYRLVHLRRGLGSVLGLDPAAPSARTSTEHLTGFRP